MSDEEEMLNTEQIEEAKQFKIDSLKKERNTKAKEHYQESKQRMSKQLNQWREANRERLTQLINCECGNTYKFENTHYHLRTKKHRTTQHP